MNKKENLFEVSGATLPDDAKRFGPLTGNDEIKLCLDARGAMHDFTPEQGSWPPPRIVWTGRRHGRTIDRYNSNLFEWGFVDVRLNGEEELGEVAHWRQRLHPRQGLIETEIRHAGGVTMQAESFVHLEKNVAVFRRRYELPGQYAMIVPGIDVDESVSARDDGPAVACSAAVSLHLAAELAERLKLDEPDAPEWRRLSKLAGRLARDIGGGFCSEFGVSMVPEPDEPADPAVVAWRRQARERRLKKQDGVEHSSAAVSGDPEIVSEWAWGHLNAAYVHANEGEADKALACLRKVPPLRLDFSALCESCSPDLSRIHHPWFTTGAGAYLRTIARMLLVADGETIRLFPGLPAGTWQELEFRLMAHGHVAVHVKLQDGIIYTLALHNRSSWPRCCRVRIPRAYLMAGQTFGARTVREADGMVDLEFAI